MTIDDAPLEKPAPRALTGIGLCQRYEFSEVRQALEKILVALGDIRRLVQGKHVSVKVNS